MLKNIIQLCFRRTKRSHAVSALSEEDIKEWIAEGTRAEQEGQFASAYSAYLRVLVVEPHNAVVLHLMGGLFGRKGDLPQAELYLQQAITLSPSSADYHVDLGNVLRLLGRTEESEIYYRNALALHANHGIASANLGRLLLAKGQKDEARLQLLRAMEFHPQGGDVLKSLIGLLIEKEQYQDALTTLERAKNFGVNEFDVAEGLGFTLQKMGRTQEALQYYLKAVDAKSGDANAWDNLGTAYQDLMLIDDALACYEKAISLLPDNPIPIWHRSLAYLLTRNYAQAWQDYDLRLVSEDRPYRNFPYPKWGGENLNGKTILVYAEQGLGDEIMFASCIPDLTNLGARCVIDCSPKLAPIFSRSFPHAIIHSGPQTNDITWLKDMPTIDFCIPAGSLPQYFRKDRESFSARRAYLAAEPARVNYWKTRLAELGPGLKVGISWRGGTRISRRQTRSLRLEQLLPILSINGAQFINLQYDESASEILKLCGDQGIILHHWPDAIENYDETAALVGALDAMISVCTAIIHLGGAMSKPVWVMVPSSPEWRYGNIGECMDWYPSVRLYRQCQENVWEDVIGKIASDLGKMIAH